MPGFVDVSNMTAQEIKRMGQMDDDYETPRQTWKPKAKPTGVKHSVDNVWGAACAAQRINGSYVKETQHRFDEDTNTTVVVKQRNRDVMSDILANPALLTVEDIAQGQACRKFLQQDITLRGLKGRLTEFDTAVSKTVAVSEEFDTVTHKYANHTARGRAPANSSTHWRSSGRFCACQSTPVPDRACFCVPVPRRTRPSQPRAQPGQARHSGNSSCAPQ